MDRSSRGLQLAHGEWKRYPKATKSWKEHFAICNQHAVHTSQPSRTKSQA